jgi:hypothetical protein
MIYFCEQCGVRIEKPGKCSECDKAGAAPVVEPTAPSQLFLPVLEPEKHHRKSSK